MIDDQLLKLVDKMSRDRRTTRSAFIRHALEAEIRHQHLRDEEARPAQGYARQIGDRVTRLSQDPRRSAR